MKLLFLDQKGFIIPNIGIVIILIIVLITGGFFLLNTKGNQSSNKLTTTPSPSLNVTQISDATPSSKIPNWKTYKNSQFSFEYPEELIIGDKETKRVSLYTVPLEKWPEAGQRIDIRWSEDKSALTDEYIEQNFPDSESISPFTISGVKGKYIKGAGCEWICDYVILQNKNILYKISLVKSPGKEISLDTYQKILNTFTLIN